MNPHNWSVAPRMVRCLLAALGTFAWLSSSVVIFQGIQIGSGSPLLWGTAAGGVLAGLAAWILSLRLSDASITTSQEFIRAKLHRDQPLTTEISSSPLRWGLLVSGVLFFAVNTTWVYHHQDPPGDDDQWAFLITAQEIHARGGIAGLWSDLWSGQFEESNRHPLLLAIQSLNPTVPAGRAISITLASLTLGLILILVWRKRGPFTAGILSVLVGANGAWLYHAPRIVCESLLTGLAGLLWLALIPSRGSTPHDTTPSLSWQSAAVGGVLAGLVYLTKGTGLLLFGGVALSFALMSFLYPQQRRCWLVAVVALSLTFLVTSSPLLARNTIRFGSPTYNVNSYLLWVDAYESPNAMAERMTLQEARTAYLASHTVSDMIKREATGLVWEAFIFLRTLGLAPWSDSRLLTGAPLLLIGLIGLSQTPRSSTLILALWTIITWGVMAWYVPIAAGDRFVMPLLIPWLTLAADGLARISHMSSNPDSVQRRIAIATIAIGLISTVLVWTRTELWAC